MVHETQAFEPQTSSLDCKERAWNLTRSTQAALEPTTPLHLVRRFESYATARLSHVGNNGDIPKRIVAGLNNRHLKQGTAIISGS